MKKLAIIITILCLAFTICQAQNSTVNRATAEQLPYENRAEYIRQATNYLQTYYSQLMLNVDELMVQQEFIKANMPENAQRYKPEFMLEQHQNMSYLTPEQYLQELEKQYRRFNADEIEITVVNVNIKQEDFFLPNHISCYVIADYDLTFDYQGKTLFKRSCRAYCLFPKISVSIIVKLMQVEPVKDIIAYQPDKKDYSLYKDITHQELQRKANQGDTKAQFTLGWHYYKGIGTTKDDIKAIEWLTKAADKGHVSAQTFLGFYFFEKENYTTAFKWFEKASILGWSQAQCQLANMYFNGQGTDENVSKAVEWYTKAAEQEYDYAQYKLGLIYLYGYSGEKNIVKAVEWLTKAAEQGNTDAQDVLKSIETIQGTDTTTQNTDNSNSDVTKTNTILGHEYVDLGLSVKWATCNIGANRPEELGELYGWGEREPHETNEKSGSLIKESSTYKKKVPHNISGNLIYDTATIKWIGSWRMPTDAEMQELIDKCKWEWVTVNNVQGYKVTGPNGNYIFLPSYSTIKDTYTGIYWTATSVKKNKGAQALLFFEMFKPDIMDIKRNSLHYIRPVTN